METVEIYCDRCKKPKARAFSFAVGSERDAAGDSDTIHKRIDLCAECQGEQLELFILSLPWSAREALARDLLKSGRLYLSDMTKAQRLRGVGQ